MKLIKKNLQINLSIPKKELRTTVSKPSYTLKKVKKITFFTNTGSLLKKKKHLNLKNFSNRNAITKTRFSGNLAINTTKQYNPREDMKNCENCKIKEIENNNIQKKVLNGINEVDHIKFQTGNKIFRCRSFFRFFSLDSYW